MASTFTRQIYLFCSGNSRYLIVQPCFGVLSGLSLILLYYLLTALLGLGLPGKARSRAEIVTRYVEWYYNRVQVGAPCQVLTRVEFPVNGELICG